MASNPANARLPAAPPINEKAATRKGAGFHSDPNSMSLFLDAVHSIASFSLAGFDLQTVFLGRSGQEAPHAVRELAGGLPNLAQRGSLRSSDQGALALWAR